MKLPSTAKFKVGRTRIIFWQFWTMQRYPSWEFGVSILRHGRGFCIGAQWPIIQRLSSGGSL